MTIILACLDGCGLDYLRASDVLQTAGLDRENSLIEGLSIVPTVTNVNAASIITGAYPETHGITTNYFYDRRSKEGTFMETPDFILSETLLEIAARRGMKTALITSKDKLRVFLQRGAHISFSAERPLSSIVKRVGAPPGIYSVDVNIWIFKALKSLLQSEKIDLACAFTTDFVMHKHGPGDPVSKDHLDRIGAQIGDILETLGGALIYLAADHGMSRKREAMDLERILRDGGVETKMVSTIKDRYVVHHGNFSGSAYIYLEDEIDLDRAQEMLLDQEGVEGVMERAEAASRYHLHPERIGDLFVLAKEDSVFGRLSGRDPVEDVDIRSHGSLHERDIPLVVPREDLAAGPVIRENKDLFDLLVGHFPGKGYVGS